MARLTPVFEQYLEHKKNHPDAILFFQMGDFYEMFFEDARLASRVLDIALTARNKDQPDPIPMCGVPCHAAENYLSRLVAAGHKVAVCNQVEDPSKAKGLVRRDVVRVVTPGLTVSESTLTPQDENFLAALFPGADGFGLAALDLSTGRFRVCILKDEEEALDELLRIGPRELLAPDDLAPRLKEALNSRFANARVEFEPAAAFLVSDAEARIAGKLKVHSIRGLGLEGLASGVAAAGAVLEYLDRNQGESAAHVTGIELYEPEDYLVVDRNTQFNLELFESIALRSRDGSLLWVLDQTRTAMGARRLKDWMARPLKDPGPINGRLTAVEELVEGESLRRSLRELLGEVYDLERLTSRITVGQAAPKDLVALRQSLGRLPAIKSLLKDAAAPLLGDLNQRIDPLPDLHGLLVGAMEEHPPATLSAGGVIREEFDPRLKKAVEAARGIRVWIAAFEAKEREHTGIQKLKVRFNKVFGYFIEVPKTQADLAPEHYQRKQTLVAAERFFTEELKNRETEALVAEETRLRIEAEIFESLCQQVAVQSEALLAVARALSELDVLASFAEIAVANDYHRPAVTEEGPIEIDAGRHPVVELKVAGSFVPNDVRIDSEESQVQIITGPNMAGKSTIIRQTALIVLMAQMGSFVPASGCRMGAVDRIFTRVGAMDDLTRGRSTFMVEMEETSSILRKATPNSLVILDEIGRGTSTYDGLAIAWAVAEYLSGLNRVGVKTMFATHFHELTGLAGERPGVKNFNVAVKEWGGEVVFLHTLVPGGSSSSLGIQVASLAGLPPEVVSRAGEVLARLEEPVAAPARPKRERPGQMSLFGWPGRALVEELLKLEAEGFGPEGPAETLRRLAQKARKIAGPTGEG